MLKKDQVNAVYNALEVAMYYGFNFWLVLHENPDTALLAQRLVDAILDSDGTPQEVKNRIASELIEADL